MRSFAPTCPVLAARARPDDDRHPGARRPARGRRAWASGCWSSSASTASARPSSMPATSSRTLVAACEAEADRYRDALDDPRAPRRRRPRRLRRGGRVGPGRARRLGRDPRRPAADRHPRGPPAADRRRACAPTGAASARSRGFWLPECAYEPGLEHLLAELGIEYFCTDQSAHEPAAAALRPIATDGPTAFPIDWEACSGSGRWTAIPSDPALRRLPPQVAARLPALVDRRRALRPGRRRRARPRAGASVRRDVAARLGALPRASGPPRPAHVRDRHRAARPLVVGGPDLARGGR